MDGPPWVLRSAGGLRAVIVDGGAPASLATDRIELVQHAASAFAPGCSSCGFATARPGGPGRCSGPDPARPPVSTTVTWSSRGRPTAPRWRLALHLDPARTAWSWHVEVLNDGPTRREVDVVHAHDVALAAPGMLRTNELYVSQYLDITPLHGDGFGTAPRGAPEPRPDGVTPWCVLACTTPVVAWATDAIDVHGWAARRSALRGSRW